MNNQLASLEVCRLSEEERHRLLVEWNQTGRAYPRDLCVHQLFERQAAETPEAVAVVCRAEQLTYAGPNESANRLARRLRELGGVAETPVGVVMERSSDAVVSLLAVLKAGGAYVPLDPQYPRERLCFMLADARVPVVLTQSHLAERLSGHSAQFVRVDDEREQIARLDAQNLACEVGPTNLAYVIYTSGAMGRPKDVAIPHRAVARLVKSADYAEMQAVETSLLLSNLSFDASTFEIWGALLNGARLV